MKRFRILWVLFILYGFAVKAQSVTVSAVSGRIGACQGTASVSQGLQQFTVSGNNLKGDIVVQAPQNFEVSLLPGSGYQTSIAIVPSATQVNNVVVYVRSAVTAPGGNISGKCTISTAGVIDQQVAVSGAINALPVVNTLPNLVFNGGDKVNNIFFSGTGEMFKWTNDNLAIGLQAGGTGKAIPSFTAVNNTSQDIVAKITVTPYFIGNAYIAADILDASVIDTHTDQIIADIPTPTSPYGVSVSPDGRRVYMTTEAGITEIDAVSNSVIATIPAGDSPHGVVVSPDGAKVYASNLNSSFISVLDVATNTVSNLNIQTPAWGVAISPDGKTLFACASNSQDVYFINVATGITFANVDAGLGPLDMVVTPDGKYLYVTDNNTNKVTKIDIGAQKPVASIQIGQNPTGITISPDGSNVYAAATYADAVSVIPAGSTVMSINIQVNQNPVGVSITPDGKKLYVTNLPAHNVSVIDLSTDNVINTIPMHTSIRGPFSVGNFIGLNPCSGAPVTFNITVRPAPPPQITASGALSALSTVYGTPSAPATFSVAGTSLTGNLVITPPPGFEVSTDGASYAATQTITGTGAVGPVNVYVRLAASTKVGGYSDNIVLTSAGAANVYELIPESTVTPASLTITADNKERPFNTPNPVLTASYAGFVNSETSAALSSPAILSTTALQSSPPGQYTIDIAGAYDPNYTIKMLPGELTIVLPQDLIIPNAFTPNGDGTNDTWDIKNLGLFPGCSVKVFNRYGKNVYSSVGYGVPWDGTFKGSALPAGTYYYLIDLNDEEKSLSGFVTILR